MWESSGRPWVGFLSTEDWGLELEISELCESYGDGNLDLREGKQLTQGHTLKWCRTRARKRLAWCPAGHSSFCHPLSSASPRALHQRKPNPPLIP